MDCVNDICLICNNKVIIFKSGGYMKVNNNLIHYECVEKYGYNKFSNKVMKYEEKEKKQ